MRNDYQQATAWCKAEIHRREGIAHADIVMDAHAAALALRAIRAFEALASGRVVLWEPQGYRTEWFATRDDDAEQTRHYAPDPLDAITKALEAPDA